MFPENAHHDRIVSILGNCDTLNPDLTICDNVHTSIFERLVKDGLAEIGDSLPDAPTNGEILDLAQRYPEITLSCAITSHAGKFPKVFISGARAQGKLSVNFLIEFATLMRKAAEFRLGTKKAHAFFLIL